MSRSRLNPDARRAQILSAAARMVVEQGYLPLPLEALAERIEVSKGLIYRYFPTQHDLVNALLRDHLPSVANAVIQAASAGGGAGAIAERGAIAYFDHVAEHGPLLQILLSDIYSAGRIDRDLLACQARVFGRLGRQARTALGLRARDSLAVVRLLAALAEEAGTQAFRGQTPPPLCREAMLKLVAGGLDGVRRMGG